MCVRGGVYNRPKHFLLPRQPLTFPGSLRCKARAGTAKVHVVDWRGKPRWYFSPVRELLSLSFFSSSFPASPGVGVNGARKRHYSRPLNIWDWVPRLYNRPRWLKNFLPCIYHLQRVPRVNVAPLVVRVWAFLRACACVGDRVCPWECVKVCVCPRAHACVRALSY